MCRPNRNAGLHLPTTPPEPPAFSVGLPDPPSFFRGAAIVGQGAQLIALQECDPLAAREVLRELGLSWMDKQSESEDPVATFWDTSTFSCLATHTERIWDDMQEDPHRKWRTATRVLPYHLV